MLQISGLHAGYGKLVVLDAINLEVGEGEFVAILGPNGAGKSTLLKSIAGVHHPISGNIVLLGRSIGKTGPADRIRMGLGTIPEGRQLFADMSVRENLILGAYARIGMTVPKSLDSDLEEVFALFPRLAQRQKQLAGSLSGGEAQMLAIARALMGKPRLLLCDEPSLGLAPMMVREMLGAIAKLRDTGITVLMADQNALAILQIADRGYVLDSGRIVAQGNSESLLGDSRLRAAYLGIGVSEEIAAAAYE